MNTGGNLVTAQVFQIITHLDQQSDLRFCPRMPEALTSIHLSPTETWLPSGAPMSGNNKERLGKPT